MTGKQLFKKTTQAVRRVLPPHAYLFLPGTILAFTQHDRNCISAIVQSSNQAKILVPAVRGMKTRSVINSKPASLGSFVPIRRIPHLTAISNILTSPKRPPTLLRAPGTYARLIKKDNQYQLLLKNKRTLPVSATAGAQLGANVATSHRHCSLGSAGARRKLNGRPHVRARAKNPHCHMSLRGRVKKYHK